MSTSHGLRGSACTSTAPASGYWTRRRSPWSPARRHRSLWPSLASLCRRSRKWCVSIPSHPASTSHRTRALSAVRHVTISSPSLSISPPSPAFLRGGRGVRGSSDATSLHNNPSPTPRYMPFRRCHLSGSPRIRAWFEASWLCSALRAERSLSKQPRSTCERYARYEHCWTCHPCK
jgi:hypothetical protein